MASSYFQGPAKIKYLYAGLFMAVLIVYLLSFVGNRSENDDGYYFACLVRDLDIQALFATKFVLTFPLIKFLYLAIQTIAPFEIDIYLFMCVLSSIFSALFIVLFFYMLFEVLNVSLVTSLLGSAFLMFSYGNWRYAVEADIYPLANVMVLSTLVLILIQLKKEKSPVTTAIATGILGGLAVLIYKPNIIPVFLCFPFLFFFTKKFITGISYGLIGGITIILGYYLTFTYGDVQAHTFRGYLFGASEKFSSGSPLLMPLVFGTRIISSNFIFYFDGIIDFLQSNFAYRIEEEIFTAKRHPLLCYLALLTALVFIATTLLLVIRMGIRRYFTPVNSITLLALLWLIAYSLVLLILDPHTLEPWNMALLPATLIFVFTLLEPYVRQRNPVIPSLLVGTLFLHNIFAGVAMNYDKNDDHVAFTADWVVRNAGAQDFIVSTGSSTLLFYMKYYSAGRVFFLENEFEESMASIEDVRATNKRIYLTQEMVEIPMSFKKRNPTLYFKVQHFIELNKHNILLVNNNAHSGKVYELVSRPQN